jgi:hypothetical protein
MAVIDFRETTEQPFALSVGTPDAPSDQHVDLATDVVEAVRQILGYDPAEQELLAEGYVAMAQESTEWADLSFSAQVETLPEQ